MNQTIRWRAPRGGAFYRDREPKLIVCGVGSCLLDIAF
jgi:hypothetical protein